MNRCGECKYWANNKRYGYGTCHNARFNYQGLSRENCYDEAPDKVIFWDFEGCGHDVGFMVGRDFGCIHFKEALQPERRKHERAEIK